MPGLNRIEVVVLLVVAAVLLLLAVPWLLQSREDARLVHCRENLRNVGLALGEYARANGDVYPYGTILNSPLPPRKRFAWTLHAASFRDRLAKRNKNVLNAFDVTKPWDAPANLNPDGGSGTENGRIRRFAMFACPADPNHSPTDKLLHSSYVGMGGLGDDAPQLKTLTPNAGLWGYDRQTAFRQITDGTEHTICVLDTARDNGPWVAGGPATIRPLAPDGQRYLGKGGQFGGHHAEGSVVLFADGRVKILANRMDPRAFSRLCTPAGE